MIWGEAVNGVTNVATILIVDDDQQLVNTIVAKLSAAGHVCLRSNDGEKALEILSREAIDLLILDVMIPGISGFEVCRRIHTNTELYALPILFISAMSGEEEVAHGLAQGADDYLPKPFKTDLLLNRVNALLATSARNALTDELTGLPGPKHAKLEIQRAVNLKLRFAVIYAELLHMAEFARALGNEARAKAIRHLGRGLHMCGPEFPSKIFTVGHMGGGHFVCIIEPQLAEDYCRTVGRLWRKHRPALQESLGIPGQASGNFPAGIPEPELLFCIAVHEPSDRGASHEIFETLTHLRQGALAASGAGIYTDRRHAPL